MEVAQEVAGSGFVPFTPVLSHLGQLLPLSPVLGDEGPCSGSCKVLLAKGRVTSEGGNEKLLVVTGNVQDHKSTL